MTVSPRLVALALLGGACFTAAAQSSSGSTMQGVVRVDRIPLTQRLAPGICALWYPDRPADRQPPAGDCAHVSSVIPPGAKLLLQPAGDDRHVQAISFDPDRRGGIASIDLYDAVTGVRIGPPGP